MSVRVVRAVGIHFTSAVVLSAAATVPSYAQVNRSAHASFASQVDAEMTKGKLSPAESKPGDTVAIKLKDDVRSNGELILKRGTTITGVIRNVNRADTKGESRGQAQSIIEIEWLVPAIQARKGQNLSFALQSVTQVNPLYAHERNDSVADDFSVACGGATSLAVSCPARGGGLLGSVGSVDGPTAGSATSSASTAASGRSNAALLRMPFVVAVDQQTRGAIESALGGSRSGELFRIGHGQLVSAGGAKHSLDLYSHLGDDTVIASRNPNYEISSGAQMQVLVGVNRK